MTLKTSLFNKGIYKSVLKRYLWGAVVYFLLLFSITVLPIFMTCDPNDVETHLTFNRFPLIYETVYTLPSVLIAIVVPTIVGLLVFRMVHSKKTSIFIHGLPVGRNSVYISSVLGGLTLMTLPVILNGLILTAMSLTAYEPVFTPASCGMWMLINLLTLFVMFSFTSFVSVITGNSFAMVVLNILIHAIVPIVTLSTSVIAETFLYGFPNEFTVMSEVVSHNTVVRMVNYALKLSSAYIGKVSIFRVETLFEILLAIVLFTLALIIYKKRNLEKAEDVAGFKVLNPIFKYLAVFLVTVCAFTIFSEFISENPFVFGVIIFIAAVVCYFTLEMVLKKTVKVIKSYKGFVGFAIMFSLMIALFAGTSFFGYETRIPQTEEIQSVAVYNHFSGQDEPYSEYASVIGEAREIHKELTAENKIYKVRNAEYGIYPATLNRRYPYHTQLHINYTLKNGKKIKRTYPVSETELYKYMTSIWKKGDFAELAEPILECEAEDVIRVSIYESDMQEVIKNEVLIGDLLDALKKDLKTLEYNQIYCLGAKGASIQFENRTKKDNHDSYSIIKNEHITINSNFKNTIKWLEENGLAQFNGKNITGDVYVLKNTVWEEAGKTIEQHVSENTRLLESADMMGEFDVMLPPSAKDTVAQFVTSRTFSYYPDEEYYEIYVANPNGYFERYALVTPEEAKALAEIILG